MIGELALYGLLFPPLLLSAGAALLGMAVLRRLLARVGFYRLVWHPALLDLSLFMQQQPFDERDPDIQLGPPGAAHPGAGRAGRQCAGIPPDRRPDRDGGGAAEAALTQSIA